MCYRFETLQAELPLVAQLVQPRLQSVISLNPTQDRSSFFLGKKELSWVYIADLFALCLALPTVVVDRCSIKYSELDMRLAAAILLLTPVTIAVTSNKFKQCHQNMV